MLKKKKTRAAQSTSSSSFTVKRQPPYRPQVPQLKRETPWASIHPPHVVLSLWTRTGCSCSSIFIVAPVLTEPIRTHSTYPQQSKTHITKTDSEFPFLMKPVFEPLPHHNSLSISPCMRLRLGNKSRAGAIFFTQTHSLTETLAPGTFSRRSTYKQQLRQIRQRLGAIRATNSCDARSAREHATWSTPRHRNTLFFSSGLTTNNSLQLKP